MSSSEAYILNKLQTPNGLWPVYKAIESGADTNEAISTMTGLDEPSVKEVVGGLRLMRMIETSEFEHSVVPTAWDTGKKLRDFQLTALSNLAEEAQNDNWGKQAVVQLNYQYLIQANKQRFDNNEQALYENIDAWIKQETSYRPKDGDSLYTHNKQKFGNWTRLVHFLGLVHKTKGREHIVYPDPELILATIKAAGQDSQNGTGTDVDVGIREYQNWLHENVIRVGEYNGESVPAVLSRTLAILASNDDIRLTEYGDSGSVTLSNVPMREQKNIDKAANSIVIA